MNLKSIPPAAWYVGGGLVAAAGLYVLAKKFGKAAGEAAAAVGTAVNPVSDRNIVYRGLNALGTATVNADTGQEFSLGASIYNLFHDDEFVAKPVYASTPYGAPANINART